MFTSPPAIPLQQPQESPCFAPPASLLGPLKGYNYQTDVNYQHSNNHNDLDLLLYPLDFSSEDPTHLFGSDFPLFDDVDFLRKSLFNDPSPSNSTSTPTSACSPANSIEPALVSDQALNQLFDFTTDLLNEDLSPSTISSTSATIPIQQAPTPSASGSEEPSDHELTPSDSERGLGLTPPRSSSTTSISTGSTPTTLPLPTPNVGHQSFFPPLELSTAPISLPSLTVHDLPIATSKNTPSVSSSRKRKADSYSPRPKELVPTEIQSDDDDREVKRKRNTAAARRYRQKKQDRMKELEEELEEMRKERDQWKTEAQRQRMEAEKWYTMVQFMQKSMGK